MPIPPVAPRSPEPTRDSAEGGTARLTVRLMDQLKAEVEAAADREGLSVNAFLVRMLAAAVQSGSPTPRQPGEGGNRISGWVQ
jgi:HicB family